MSKTEFGFQPFEGEEEIAESICEFTSFDELLSHFSFFREEDFIVFDSGDFSNGVGPFDCGLLSKDGESGEVEPSSVIAIGAGAESGFPHSSIVVSRERLSSLCFFQLHLYFLYLDAAYESLYSALSVRSPVRRSVDPSVDPSVRPSFRPSIRPFVHPSFLPSVRPSDRPTV